MAKHQSAKNGSDAAKLKTTIHLDSEYMMALNILSSSKGVPLSGFIQSLIASHISNLPRKESDAIRALISVNTGKILRIGKDNLSPTDIFEEEDIRRAEPLVSRISKIHAKSTAPLDRVIAVEYGEE